MALSTPGVGSGLDVNSIVNQLVALEKQPLQKLQQKGTAIQAQVSSWGKLQSLIDSLRTAATRLSTATTWAQAQVTSSDATTVSASMSSSGTASAGRYAVNVSQLAQEHTLASSSMASGADLRGSLRIELGRYSNASPPSFTARSGTSAIDLTFTDAATTLEGVRDAINAATTAVKASILTDGSGQRLVVSSTTTGADQAIRITASSTGSTNGGSATTSSTSTGGTTGSTGTTGTGSTTGGALSSLTGTAGSLIGGSGSTSSAGTSGTAGTTGSTGTSSTTATPTGLALLAYDGSSSSPMTQTRQARDAAFTVNGVSMTSSSNTLDGTIQGLRVQLLKAGGSPVDLTVENDKTGQRKLIEDFVTAYNAVNTQLAADTGFDATSRKGGVFQGDSSALSVRRQLREVISQSSTASSRYARLSDIGLDIKRDGSIAVDATKLGNALEQATDLKAMLSNAGSAGDASRGLAVRLKALADQMIGSDGLLPSKADALKDRLTRNQSDQDRLNDRIEATRQRLLRQYQAVDAKVARLNGLGSYVNQQFGGSR